MLKKKAADNQNNTSFPGFFLSISLLSSHSPCSCCFVLLLGHVPQQLSLCLQPLSLHTSIMLYLLQGRNKMPRVMLLQHLEHILEQVRPQVPPNEGRRGVDFGQRWTRPSGCSLFHVPYALSGNINSLSIGKQVILGQRKCFLFPAGCLQ